MLRLRSLFALSLALFVAPVGCGDDPEGKNTGSGEDGAVDASADVVIPETTVEDTGSEPDTTIEDTGTAEDSTVADTGTLDTGTVVDSGTLDTGTADTAMPDTSPPPDAPMCSVAGDCPGTDTECAARACVTGKCTMTFVAAGTLTSTGQTGGDCKKRQCNGAGVAEVVYDPLDLPNDSNQCTDDFCTGATPTFMPRSAGYPCATPTGGKVCDGTGSCVECITASDCPGTDGECTYRTCSAGKCGMITVPPGGLARTQTPGDCAKWICNAPSDGGPLTRQVADESDPPPPVNECMVYACGSDGPSYWYSYNTMSACDPCGTDKLCWYSGETSLSCQPKADVPFCEMPL